MVTLDCIVHDNADLTALDLWVHLAFLSGTGFPFPGGVKIEISVASRSIDSESQTAGPVANIREAMQNSINCHSRSLSQKFRIRFPCAFSKTV